MHGLRVALVTARFWPLLGGEETIARHLATGLAEAGCEVTVLTARWRQGWPETFSFCGARVVRIGPPPHGRWQTLVYLRHLASWLRRRQNEFDVVYVFGLRYEALAALLGWRGATPVVRVDRVGGAGDASWLRARWAGRWLRRLARRGARFVVSSAAAAAETAALGMPAENVLQIPPGVPLPPPRTAERRRAARAVLAATQVIFELPDEVPLVVACGRLMPGRGLHTLVAAFARLVERRPQTRLWLVGDGPEYLAVQKQINDAALTTRAVLCGAFECVDEILAAADVACCPSAQLDTGMALLEAMAAGLPLVAIDTPARRELATDEAVCFVPADDPAALAASFDRLLSDQTFARQLGATARQCVETRFPLAQMVQSHVTYLQSQKLVG